MSKDKRGPRVGFNNYGKVAALMQRRDKLELYSSGFLTIEVSTAALPAELRGVFQVPELADLLKRDAVRQVAEIDRELEALGFDTSENE